MQPIRAIILTFLFFLPLTLPAQQKEYDNPEIEAVLTELDSVVAHKKEYQAARMVRIDSLWRVVNSCSPTVYVQKCQELYDMISDVDGKRTLQVLELIEKTNQYKNDPNMKAWVDLNASRTYGIMGLYHKANAITDDTDPRRLSEEERLHYYSTCLGNYEKIADYMSDIDVAQDEERQTALYYDSILALLPKGLERDLTIANKEVYLDHADQARTAMEKILMNEGGTDYIRTGLTLASIQSFFNDKDRCIYYLARTAIEDLKSGTTDYKALAQLVLYLFEEEHIDRAYKYLMCTMEDANAYPSRSLALNVARYFPLINSSYSAHKEFLEKSDTTKRNSLAFTFALLALSIAVAFYLGWHQNVAAVEKKRADELQKALDQASVADRIKTVFIQNMRHEIRTPLNAIMGFAQLMSNDLSDEERELYNGYIQESNNQLLSTLDDIIDVSNMEVGTFNFHFEHIDIDELCKEHITTSNDLLASGVELSYQPLKHGLKLYSDKKRVGQVLYNLITNACKNTTEGSITLSVAHYIANDCIQFVVTDTGRGIPPEKAEVVFEHFEKLDHYSPGLGLGLYVCRLIARALGGDIYLDTRYTTGARFVFTVPNQQSEQESDSEKELVAQHESET